MSSSRTVNDAPTRTRAGKAAIAAAGASAAVVGATAIEIKRRLAKGGGVRSIAPSADMVREVAARMTTPLLPDDYLHMLNPLWTARELRGKVVNVVPETDDAATLIIKPGWGFSFDYQPGQYVGIGISVDGKWHWRSYSLSSPPTQDQGHISITVKAMPEGFLSTHLVRGLEPGSIVRLALPQGEFVLPDPPPSKILFWTGGSGVTPVMAILRTLHRRDTMTDVVHVHAAPTQDAVIFRDELHDLAAKYPTFTLIENIDETDGILDVKKLTEVVPDWRERQAWVCGPTPMLDAAEKQWNKSGIGKQLHLERFSANLSESAEGGRVTFLKSGKEVDVDGATTLMEAGEAQGIQMPFGCRMGICHTCVIPLKKGTVKDLRNGNEYTDNQGIQTCITAAAGDCTLDI
ncbi:MAG: stearoyl-CoA 9-desaturase oxidoreductase [Frankiales bacterium]|jgi:ferredoxin-NADP reductase|nr:stearoyl-CoA 9-desaturase oxidoreductase [Frankiales bacterium]